MMLRVLGFPTKACDGITRRELLTAGLFAPALGQVRRASAASRKVLVENEAKQKNRFARAFILIDLFGGPSHLDTFDPKPQAPPEIRGEFSTIATSIPGLRICEHLPNLATRMHRCALIRTVSHRYNSHNPYAVMTGFDGGQDQLDYFAKPTHHPSVPSVCQYLGVGRSEELPGYVMLPAHPGYSQGLRRAGPYGGYLGPRWDPLSATADRFASDTAESKDFYNPDISLLGEPSLPKLQGDLTLDVLNRRRRLIDQLDTQQAAAEASPVPPLRQAAFNLLLSAKARAAFDLEREPDRVRERYGRDLFGQSVLLARRLVEAGVSFITVHTEARPNGHWDTHENNFNMLKRLLLPFLDRALSALLDDLTDRGMLGETLILVTGDMGRQPKINHAAGRDHWPQCGFALFAGGGTRPGAVLGTSDRLGAYPVEHPVSMGDLAATVYRQMGVDPEATVPDHLNRPIPISHGGRPLSAILI